MSVGKIIKEALKIDNSWLYELCLEEDKRLKEEIMSGQPIHIATIAPITAQDLLS